MAPTDLVPVPSLQVGRVMTPLTLLLLMQPLSTVTSTPAQTRAGGPTAEHGAAPCTCPSGKCDHHRESQASRVDQPEGITLRPGLQLLMGAQYRARGTADTGLDFVSLDNRANVSHRARLSLGFKHEVGVEAKISVQDVRVFGEELHTLDDFDANGLDFHEAFGLIRATPWFVIRVGRQEIALDNQRIMGAVDWTQRARSLDGARLLFNHQAFESSIFGAKVREDDARGGDGHVTPDTTFDVDLLGAHAKYSFGEALKLSGLFLAQGLNGQESRYTLGLYGEGKAAGLGYSAEGYAQLGSIGNEGVGAFLVAGRFGYTASIAAKPSLTAFVDVVSGDGTPQGSFDTSFATNHKFYGEMDLFLNTVLHTMKLGLIDAGGRMSLSPVEGLDCLVDFHRFMSMEALEGETGFGTEIDVRITYKPWKVLTLEAFYGVFLPGDLMRSRFKIPDGADTTPEHLGYLSLDWSL